MNHGIELRVDLFPLVVTSLNGHISDAHYEAYFADFERVVAQKRSFASMVDTTRLESVPSAAQRKRIADVQAGWMARHGADMGVGVALIVQNSLVRGAMTALHWLMPPPVPTQAFASEAQAIEYLVGCLEKRGVVVTDGIRARLARSRLAS